MKNVIVLSMLCLLVAGCNEGRMSTWTLTSQNIDTKALVGYNVDGAEAGAVCTWHPIDDTTWGPEPTAAGFYVGSDASWLVSVEDTPEDAIVPFAFLDGLNAVPYGRIEWQDYEDNGNFSNLEPQFVGGTRFLLNEDGTIAIAVEYSDGDLPAQNRGTYIGANFQF